MTEHMSRKDKDHKTRAVSRELAENEMEQSRNYDWSHAVRVPATRYESKLISIRLPMPMISNLRSAAEVRNIGYQQLIKQYISDGLHKDNAMIGFRGARMGTYAPFVLMVSSSSASLSAEIPVSTPVSGDSFIRTR